MLLELSSSPARAPSVQPEVWDYFHFPRKFLIWRPFSGRVKSVRSWALSSAVLCN
jgi:hypothetical protein